VTIGFFLAGRLRGAWVVPYIASQIGGALLASVAILLLFGGHAHLGATLPAGSVWQSLGLETLLTWMLMFVILCVSTGSKEVGAMAGMAVGGVIALEAMFAGPISGASMNPARSLAPALVSGTLAGVWVYIVGPMLGAALAVPCWRLTRGAAGSTRNTNQPGESL
jgi:aquaporin Z